VLVSALSILGVQAADRWRLLSHGGVQGHGETRDFASIADRRQSNAPRSAAIAGTPLFSEAGTTHFLIFVRVGTFDDPNLASPAMTIWTSSAPRWACH